MATKRALRAIFKSVDFCAREPELFAQALVDEGHTRAHDYALQALNEIPYGQWRQSIRTPTVRFFAPTGSSLRVLTGTSGTSSGRAERRTMPAREKPASAIQRITFIVRLIRAPSGQVTGVVERVRTGEKAPVVAVEDVGAILAEMLAREGR